jgi:eukaryotic-like serine/threonine-protein kinase
LRIDEASQAERFVIGQRLGRGGMGVVHRAVERATGREVAIKFLRRLDGDSLFRFKHEFRALADLAHPNLVDLYELFTIGDEWCFTMELVDGVRFDEYLGIAHEGGDVHATASTLLTPSSAPLRLAHTLSFAPPAPSGAPHRVSERLWPALAQLVDAVQALHRAGKLHRDLKPSNVLVTSAGRVVVCDFGLITELHRAAADIAAEPRLLGTPFYMSPEQAAGQPSTPAADWYSVGVMLYQALTGRLPFSGEAGHVLWHKTQAEPPPPRQLNRELAPELDGLCLALLRRDPATRAGGHDILALLGRRAGSASDVASATPFVGRAREQQALHDALAATRRGRAVSVFVFGLSGMGKTALVRRFLDEVAADEHAIVLAGRCYERESVPYKALDTIVDALSSHLVRLAADELERVLPPDIGALARLFPVMRRVHAAPELRHSPDPHELRRRALAALRHILQRLAERRPVVLFVDDLQWGDIDSAPFLADLMHNADAPPVLLLTSFRREDAEVSPLLRRLRQPRLVTGAPSGDLREIALEPLTRVEAEALGRRVLADHDAAGAARIAADSGGSPLFVLELARAGEAAHARGLEDVILARIDGLPEPARRLLTAVAVAGHPTPQSVLAASLGFPVEPALVNQLRAERLLRTSSADGEAQLEAYHDRIREALVARLGASEQQAVHRGLARGFAAREGAEPQLLAEHWSRAGEPAEAARYALLAAARAEESLAFHRAVTYYELALGLGVLAAADVRRVQARLAAALASAGRLADAAALSLEAARAADPVEALELRRKAMECQLFAGRLKEGLDSATEVARGVGLRVPRTLRAALFAVARGRLAIRWRGLDFHERSPEDITPEQLRRLDVCWSLAQGISFVDPMLGMGFQARHLLEALDAGEPYRASLALSLEIGYRSTAGTRRWRQVEALFGPATALAERTRSPQALALCHACIALAYYLVGHWRRAFELCRQAERLWRDHGTQMRSANDVLQVYLLSAMINVGETRDLGALMQLYLQEALERGDVYAANALKTWRSNVVWLVGDRPDDARRLATEARLQSLGEAFHLHHHHELMTHTHIDLYVGDLAGAWQRLESTWPALAGSHLFRIQAVFIEAQLLRGAVAVGWASASPRERAAALRVAARCVKRIARERSPWGDAVATLIQAGVAHVRGERAAAIAHLGLAAARLDAFDMPLYAAVARRRLGQLVGGDDGRAAVARADAFMKAKGVVDPERLARMYAPGFD